MPVPRLLILTNAARSTAPTTFLTDRDRFPADDLFTSDLTRARSWKHPVGCRRWVRRNAIALPMLLELRRVWVEEGEDGHPARLLNLAAPVIGRRTGKPGKPSPNKRSKRATAKGSKVKRKEVRKLSRKAATSRPPRAAKVA